MVGKIVPVFFGATFLLLLSLSSSAPCKKNDWKQLMLQCDPKTRTRSLVYYLNANCSGGALAPAPVHGIPCDCPPGKGLSGKLENNKCLPCEKGQYGAGGEIINNWGLWTNNGSSPPEELGMITFCHLSRNYPQPCRPWKASADNLTVDSGDNAMTQCLTSVLIITKKFVMPDSRVSFDYRVDGRKCRRPNYLLGCDGLGFFIDNKQVVNYSGNVFLWSTVTFNVTAGMHTLKWIYHKSCYSFPSASFVDKAFIRSITLVGTEEPNVTCTQCPPGYYCDQMGSSSCKLCPYFHHQPQKGQSKCEPCPADTFSLLGAANCFPLPNCTTDDIIAAPGNLSACLMAPNESIVTTVHPEYISVQGLTDKLLCKPVDSTPLLTSQVLCSCQPGFRIYNKGDKVECQPCDKGSYSEGLECIQCQKGHVALPGKHFSLWHYRTLPEGFSSNCVGDCSVEGGWISAGNLIRTGRALGNSDSYLQTPTFSVDSPLAKVMFNCSVTCVVSGIQKEGKPPRGENLASIQDCNLVFEIYVNDTLLDQVNCTSPKGRYVYRHDNRRDGEIVQHVYPLKKANYSFRWVFHQVDESRSLSAAYEGKIYNISVLGVSGGEARNCTPCPPGFRSVSGNTDCAICPVGTASSAGSDTCNRCGEGYFASKEGSETCLRCGNNTKPTKNKDGCGTNNCKFSPAPGVEYDLSRLSRPGGPMIEALTYQIFPRPRPRSRPGSTMRRLSIWPVKPSFFMNLCTLEHDNTSCTYREPATGLRKSLPVMACRTSWWSRDISVGTVISYNAKKDVRSGLMVELLHGDRCYAGKGMSNYSTTLDFVCDVKAGVGNPGPENNYTDVMRGRCRYYFVWRSLYACPKCRKIDVTAIYGECVNGTRNITYMRSLPCWGFGDDADVPTPQTEECVEPTETVTVVIVNTTVSYLVKESNKVNNILIGVGVVVIVALLAVAALFVYKHRAMKYRYYTLMARNKPMSRLEKEDDENSFFGDQEPDPFDNITGPVRT